MTPKARRYPAPGNFPPHPMLNLIQSMAQESGLTAALAILIIAATATQSARHHLTRATRRTKEDGFL